VDLENDKAHIALKVDDENKDLVILSSDPWKLIISRKQNFEQFKIRLILSDEISKLETINEI
jgi:hypothetical protein